MTHQQILDKLESMHDQSAKKFKGSNEADLDFKENVARWIESLYIKSDSINNKTNKDPFKKGDRIKITKCLNDHEFNIGDVVTVIDYVINEALCIDDAGNKWYISEDEGEVVYE